MNWRDVVEGDASWAVVQGDCVGVMAELPDGCVTHVITDPPYSEHVHSKQRSGAKVQRLNGRGVRFSVARDLGFESITERLAQNVASYCARLTKRWVLIFTDEGGIALWRECIENAGLDHVRMGAWVKPGAAPQFTGDRPAAGWEAIEIAHPSGRKRWNGGGRPNVWTHEIVRTERTQKPLALMEALVRDFTDPGDLVLDPFAGSGTTGVACRRLGRRFVGIERDEKYVAVARRRIGETLEQPELLSDEAFRREAKRKRPQLGLGFTDEEQDK